MSQYQVTGELTDSRHLTLDQPIPLEAGKVRVIVQDIPSERKPDLAAFEHALRQRQQARGHQPRSPEEVNDYLNAERDSWGP